MKSVSFAIGVTVGLLLVVILLKYVNRDKALKTEYDERQKALRGRSYMFGFFGMAIANCIMLFVGIENMDVIRMMGMNAFFIPILIGIVVQFSHSIFNDCYVGLNNNIMRFMVCMSLISVFNLVFGIMAWINGGFIQDGEVYPGLVNLEVGVMFIILAIEMAIKKCIDTKVEEDI